MWRFTMTSTKRLTIMLWIISLVLVAVIARAQSPTPRATNPTVISGSDLGFRVERRSVDRVAGTLVVRITFVQEKVDRVVQEVKRDSQLAVAQMTFSIQYRNAVINAVDADGVTALMIAARNVWQESAALLIRSGADPRTSDKNGLLAG